MKIWLAFLKRDIAIHASYKIDVAVTALSIFFSALIFYFVAKLVNPFSPESLLQYGGRYFPFVLIGLAAAVFQGTGLQALAQSLREEMQQGTLEQIFACPIRLTVILPAFMLWDFLKASVQAAVYLAVGISLYPEGFSRTDIPAAASTLVLTALAYMGIGILSSACVLKFKRGDPVGWAVNTVSELLSGVYFPIVLLPGFLRSASNFIPLTHGLDGLRRAILTGASIRDIRSDLGILVLFDTACLAAGFIAFRWALDSCRREGSLGHY